MSSQHRKPMFAFIVLVVLCGMIVGNAIRAQASQILASAGATTSVVLGGVLSPRPSTPKTAEAADRTPVLVKYVVPAAGRASSTGARVNPRATKKQHAKKQHSSGVTNALVTAPVIGTALPVVSVHASLVSRGYAEIARSHGQRSHQRHQVRQERRQQHRQHWVRRHNHQQAHQAHQGLTHGPHRGHGQRSHHGGLGGHQGHQGHQGHGHRR